MNSSAMIYVDDGSTAQSLSTTAAKMTGFTTDGHDDKAVGGGGPVDADASNDQIVITGPGTYLVGFQCSGSLDTANLAVRAALRRDTTEIASHQCEFAEDDTDTDAQHSMSFSGPIRITEAMLVDGSLDLSVYVESLSGTPDFTPVQAQFWAVQLSSQG